MRRKLIPAAMGIFKKSLMHRAGTAWAYSTRCAPRVPEVLLLIALTLPMSAARSLLAPGLGLGAAAVTTLEWAPQYPLHQGLQLLPGTYFHDYGALPPLDLGNGRQVSVPACVDLSRYAPPVGDQGYVPSCTSWAATYTLVGWYIAKERLPVGYMAPLYTYHQVTAGGDDQISGPAALAAAANGMLPMQLYPQGNYVWRATPNAQQLALAQHWYVLNPRTQWLAPVLSTAATIVKGGLKQHDQTAWHAGEEVVWTGSGFQPDETVSLYWDSCYRAYLTVLPGGIWSVEWYNHPSDPVGPHNLHPPAGVHVFAAVGDRGDHVALQFTER